MLDAMLGAMQKAPPGIVPNLWHSGLKTRVCAIV